MCQEILSDISSRSVCVMLYSEPVDSRKVNLWQIVGNAGSQTCIQLWCGILSVDVLFLLARKLSWSIILSVHLVLFLVWKLADVALVLRWYSVATPGAVEIWSFGETAVCHRDKIWALVQGYRVQIFVCQGCISPGRPVIFVTALFSFDWKTVADAKTVLVHAAIFDFHFQFGLVLDPADRRCTIYYWLVEQSLLLLVVPETGWVGRVEVGIVDCRMIPLLLLLWTVNQIRRHRRDKWASATDAGAERWRS